MKIVKQVTNVKVKTLLSVVCSVVTGIILYKVFFSSKEEYHFMKLTPEAAERQWRNVEDFLTVFHHHGVPLMLFDVEILQNIFVPRTKFWKNSKHKCKVLCKYHPEDKYIISFATIAKNFQPVQDDVVRSLEHFGFTTHITDIEDPRLAHLDGVPPVFTPTYLWLARKGHLIHITILHERHNFVWAGPVPEGDWQDAEMKLANELGEDWHSLDHIGAKFPRHSQAYDLSHHFVGLAIDLDGHHLNVPYHIDMFLREFNDSLFRECNHNAARQYRKMHPIDATTEELEFQKHGRVLLKRAKEVLDDLKVPFWLSSGTCLGWLRECDIIPHSKDVDIGVWADDYNPNIIQRMERKGLLLKHIFGKVSDSYELSFIDEHNIKLDIFFFYKNGSYAWNGGTVAHNGQKLKYLFPMFDLCWTEFVELRVRVPCETERYIIANYGKGWKHPVKEWQWDSSAYNVLPNGEWPHNEREEVIQVFDPVAKGPPKTKTLKDQEK